MRLGRLTLNTCLLLTLAVLLVTCEGKSPEPRTLTDEKIARIMADLSIADAATNGLAGFAKDSLMQVYFKQVFEIHGITLEVYEKDLRILAKDLEQMERVVKMSDELLTEKAPGKSDTPQK